MTDSSNYEANTKELLHYLSLAEFAIREELVLKIAILAEKFFTEPKWYFDTMFLLIIGAGEISDDVWHRLVQIVSSDESLHVYAARRAMDSIGEGGCGNIIKISVWILGEYGCLIAKEEGCNPIDQLRVVDARMMTSSVAARYFFVDLTK
jgi:AP-2 complex subunit alpha